MEPSMPLNNIFTSSHLHIIIMIKVICTWRAVWVEGSELGITPPVGKRWN